MKRLMLTCRQMPDALLQEPKGLREKFSLRIHLFVCERCRTLEGQYRALQRGLERLARPVPASAELCQKILLDFNELKKH